NQNKPLDEEEADIGDENPVIDAPLTSSSGLSVGSWLLIFAIIDNSTDIIIRPLPNGLPKTVIPSHYELFIDATHVEQNVFTGIVDIDLQINEMINEIILNSVDLNITKTEYQQKKTNSYLLDGSVEYDKVYEQVTIKFIQPINAGNGRLHMEFIGVINDQPQGFYRTKYKSQICAFTQFEPANARRAFPCFDEPSLKAKFTICIRAPKHLTTLSNMPIKSQQNDTDQACIHEFDTTPIIATYSVAYVIGAHDFVAIYAANNELIYRHD
ncbi:unnamed protein product, partial [Rotaria sp. Silwood2]